MASLKQMRAQAELDDNSTYEMCLDSLAYSLSPTIPSEKMPCWNKEKGFRITQPDDGGDEVFCHEKDLKDGEGSGDEGNTAQPKVSSDDMPEPSLTQTAKQSCEPQARTAAAARCMMTRGGSGVRKQPSRSVFWASPKATPRH